MFRATESSALSVPKLQEAALGRLTEGLLPNGGSYLEVKIDAIHEGLTRNFTYYTKDGLTGKLKNEQGYPSGLESWTKPSNTPILKDHNATADNQIGRVVKAEWKEAATKGGKPCIQLTAHITEPQSIEKFLRGEYQTGSIGMDVDAAFCSVCDENLKESPWGAYYHEHQRGKYYKKAEKGSENEGSWIETKEKKGAKLAFVRVGNVWAHEYSVVATPSDGHSKVVSMEIKEMSIKSGEGATAESINLLTPAFLQESTETLPTDVPTNVNADGTVNEDDDEKTGGTGHISVAEMCQFFRDQMEEDLVSLYFEMAAFSAALAAGQEVTVGIGSEGKFLNAEAINTFIKHLEQNNEELEAELNAVRECVLSTENTTKLPDSAFALVKTAGEKTLRALPYRTAEGAVASESLLVSLSRAAMIPTFTSTERAKAVKKLIAAGRKAAVAKPATEAEQLEAAKEMLKGIGGHQLLTDAAVEALEKKAGGARDTRVTELEEQLAEAKGELVSREAEQDALLEQVADLTTQVETVTTTQRATLVESILTLEGVEEADKPAKLAELEKLEPKDLAAKLAELAENRIIITGEVPRRGVAGGTENIEKNGMPEIPAETAIASFLGSPRAKAAVAEARNTK